MKLKITFVFDRAETVNHMRRFSISGMRNSLFLLGSVIYEALITKGSISPRSAAHLKKIGGISLDVEEIPD